MERVLELTESFCTDANLLPVMEKVAEGRRLSFEDGLLILDSPDLNTIGMMADYVKRKKSGEKVYFVVNRHINPSNICAISCRFCAFGTTKKSPNAYELSDEQMLSMLSEEMREVHIVGGLHPDWEFDHYLDIVKMIKRHFPDIHVKAFTAVEIDWFSEISGLSLKDVLLTLQDAGVDALTGGGAEILHEEVRKKICAPKTVATRWEEIHRLAHTLGIPTNATILYGHLEKPFHVVDHMERLRRIEDESPGFLRVHPRSFPAREHGS